MAATNRRQKRQIRTRAGLIKAAYEIMSKKGVSDTSIQEITDRADVGFGTFYNYFESKDALAEQVLDCVIHNLGQRNRLATERLNETDPVAVISTSVRLTAREMRTNPMWRWWLKRTDLMVHRMLIGFRPFGLHDMAEAQKAAALSLPHRDADTAWRFLIWLLAGTITDIVTYGQSDTQESRMAEAIMRVMGVAPEHAIAVSRLPLPDYPDLPVDFSFSLPPADQEQAGDETTAFVKAAPADH